LEFKEVSIAPAEHVVVVRNRARFEEMNGTEIRIIGEYTGALSNRSDQIRLLLPAPFAGAIADFAYDDDWQPATDGNGPSLVVRDVRAAARNLQDAYAWRSSHLAGGSPGRAESNVSPDFNLDGRVDVRDVDFLCTQIHQQTGDSFLDLTGDDLVDHEDMAFMVVSVLRSRTGDVNLDGRFDSRDLIAIFQTAEYDDGIMGNSTWSTGDWTCDGEFDSSDLVVAFQTGGYSSIARRDQFQIAAAIDFSDEDAKLKKR